MKQARQSARDNAVYTIEKLTSLKGVNLRFTGTHFYNEAVLQLEGKTVSQLLSEAEKEGIQLGINVSKRLNSDKDDCLLMSFFDVHQKADLDKLIGFFEKHFSKDSEASWQEQELPKHLMRSDDVQLPQFDHKELKEYYEQLGRQNVSPDEAIYPLGSCTMKYNPYINDWAASLKGFTDIHPESAQQDAQGSLEVLYNIQEMFKEITGLPGVTTQPVAGAQGELTGLKLFHAYHADNQLDQIKDIILIPKSAHGTNPASAAVAGYAKGIVLINADDEGRMDLNHIKELIQKFGKRIAGVMVTNPNTSGIFECNFKEIADLIHEVDGLVYMDGANMNAIAGWVDLGKLGVDAVHNNLHKTWSISHGGGGPGDAIVAVSEKLIPYLPGYLVEKSNDKYHLVKPEKSIGSIHRHLGNFAHKIRTYTYLRALGPEGVRRMSAVAVLSAKYLHQKLNKIYPTLPAGAEKVSRMHEFILTLAPETFERIEKAGIPKAQIIPRIGKLFLDYGFHAPTVAFPEPFGLMVEPTESFTQVELDRFAEVVTEIGKMINEHPEVLQTTPHFTPVSRVDEVSANKNLQFFEVLDKELPKVLPNLVNPAMLQDMEVKELSEKILKAHYQ